MSCTHSVHSIVLVLVMLSNLYAQERATGEFSNRAANICCLAAPAQAPATHI